MPEPDPHNELPRSEGEDDEDMGFEIAFYEGILERNPNSVDVLMALGNNYTRSGLYEKGLAIDRRLCGLRANDPGVHYNLACSYALLGDVDRAIETLGRAVVLGYRDFAHLQRDPDLEVVRGDPRYLALLERLLRQELRS